MFSAVINSAPVLSQIVVEGHTDRQMYGRTPEESQNNNLKLSQDRSMAVVEEALADLNGREPDGSMLLKSSRLLAEVNRTQKRPMRKAVALFQDSS